MICLEVMQVFIMCPIFYSLLDNSSKILSKKKRRWKERLFMLVDVNSIFKQALDRSPAYGSIQEVLHSFHTEQVRVTRSGRKQENFVHIYRKHLKNKKNY